MPIYEYDCGCGHRFETLARSVDSPAPPCPACGGVPRRRPASRVALLGRARLPPGRDRAPRSWEQTNGGDQETILHWQHALEQRQKIEEKYPELADDTRPVLAHEGPYATEPLRAGPQDQAGDAGHAPAHGHAHGHAHGYGRPARPASTAGPAGGQPPSPSTPPAES
jgi:putative FmdB family regulatory protein